MARIQPASCASLRCNRKKTMPANDSSIACEVLRSATHDYMYLYVVAGTELADLPAQLYKLFGAAEKVLELELHEGRRLAREDVRQVMANLREQGYHLQMPPSDDPSGWLDLPAKGAQ
jgi:uncharacterized protein YcgL (UPF0745 family)